MSIYISAVCICLRSILGGHCKSLAPEYEKLAKNFQGIIKIGAINCDEEKELAGYFGIKGNEFICEPTLKTTRIPYHKNISFQNTENEGWQRI